jgi:hypothetical protein
MALPSFIQKTLVMKPEVEKIFDDLDAWLDHCRFNMLPFNPADLYRSQEYRNFQRYQNGGERRPYLGKKPRFENKSNGERFSR